MTNYDEKIKRLSTKLEQLKTADIEFKVAHSSKHKYQLSKCLSIDEVQQFENENNISLPESYKIFITKFANGGAGPHSGFYSLQTGYELAVQSANDVSAPFELTEQLNPLKEYDSIYDYRGEKPDDYCEAIRKYENEILDGPIGHNYFSKKHMNGVIYLCDLGYCGKPFVIINGDKQGNIWTDARCTEEYGIMPWESNIWEWYETWLDDSLRYIHYIKRLFYRPTYAKKTKSHERIYYANKNKTIDNLKEKSSWVKASIGALIGSGISYWLYFILEDLGKSWWLALLLPSVVVGYSARMFGQVYRKRDAILPAITSAVLHWIGISNSKWDEGFLVLMPICIITTLVLSTKPLSREEHYALLDEKLNKD